VLRTRLQQVAASPTIGQRRDQPTVATSTGATMEQPTTTHRTVRRAIAVATAVVILGLAGAGAIASTDEPAAVAPCRADEADLLRAAGAARELAARRPELLDGSSRARFDDLRLAAEWARRLEALAPGLVCGPGGPSAKQLRPAQLPMSSTRRE
jgi:hypothetical protein